MFTISRSAKGQGLAEYALILVLVAVVAILILVVLGEQTQQVFCSIISALGENAPDVEACEAPRVTCSGIDSNPIRMEAIVSDNNGTDSIANVQFYVDGAHIRTEYSYRYCLSGGDLPCGPYALPSGSHTIRAVATDDDGYSGSCEASFTIP
ncbi:MAG: hypothetical protein JXB47_21470 [Anaerolineae bacterium]|nr:hypothetical protein [Anaerolineae bacterium]